MNAARTEEETPSTADDSHPDERSPARQNEVFSYTAPWPLFGASFFSGASEGLRLAVSSFLESPHNFVEIIQLNEPTSRFEVQSSFEHFYPPTKLMWSPNPGTADLLATSGDGIYLWQCRGEVSMKTHLVNTRHNDFCAPLTSFDWNAADCSMLGTSSLDTTCTIWDLEKSAVRTQLIAHEKEVYDFAFSNGIHVFGSVGADGSVRLFDLRNLEQSIILYENPDFAPLLRLGWNKRDDNYIATLSMDSNTVVVLDVRSPAVPVTKLFGHQSNVNSLAWAPHSPSHICTAGDDCQALIWDLRRTQQSVEWGTEPMLSYSAASEITTMQWSHTPQDWVAIAFQKTIQVLKV